MKIGLDSAPAAHAGTPSQYLAEILSRHAPEHEYVIGGHNPEIDIYHSFRPMIPFSVYLRRRPSVVTVPNLHFLRYPHLASHAGRLFRMWAYRRALQAASRVITVNTPARKELAERLHIDPRKIEVVMPLAALAPHSAPTDNELESVRRKYDLPKEFILMLGAVEPRHNHAAVFEALAESSLTAGIVVCGRRTTYSDELLEMARECGIAARVDFLYELTRNDLPVLFRLARAFVYLPEAELEASIVPVVEALRSELPMVLSDTQLNREAAGDAAVYVSPGTEGEVAAALENVLCDADFRRDMRVRERQRAELFSEYAVAQRLLDIYNSL